MEREWLIYCFPFPNASKLFSPLWIDYASWSCIRFETVFLRHKSRDAVWYRMLTTIRGAFTSGLCNKGTLRFQMNNLVFSEVVDTYFTWTSVLRVSNYKTILDTCIFHWKKSSVPTAFVASTLFINIFWSLVFDRRVVSNHHHIIVE